MTPADVDVRHRWTSDAARSLYEALHSQLREVLHKRDVDLGISIADGDEQSATALLRHNRSLRMSDEHRAAVWEAWQRVIDPLVKRMADIYGEHTVPDMRLAYSVQ